MKKGIFDIVLAGCVLLVGCSGTPDQKPTAKEASDFKGKGLTPEQLARFRAKMGGGGGPAASSGPTAPGGAAPAPAPATGN